MIFDENRVKDFWNTAIEGWIVGDLKRLVEQPYDPQKKTGNLNFAIALVALAAIELAGSLYKGIAEGKEDGFKDFIMEYFPEEYRKDDKILGSIWQQARNGLAHALLPKLGIIISRNDRGRHLTWNSDNELTLDADTLVEDFFGALKAYKLDLGNNLRDSTGKPLKENLGNALRGMWEHQNSSFQAQLARVSTTTSWSTTSGSGTVQIRPVAGTPPPLRIMESDGRGVSGGENQPGTP